ncbi:MAG: carboxypeptidase regulatory-like domain-containing protein [Ignavibacterium sp.]|nr:MAG: carboxypeptidase regulatory-like domain-containing protein [Ignavibacterium sp.]
MRHFVMSFIKSLPSFGKVFSSLIGILFYISIIICCFSCSKISVSEISTNKHTGDIYGKIGISGPFFSLKDVTVFIQGESKSTKTDSTGYFFIPDISPGKYSVTARTKGFADCTIKMVEVSSDSTTIITQHILYESTYNKFWKGIKVKKIDIRNRGVIKGRVIDAISDRYIKNAAVFIEGTPWIAYTDSTGTYESTKILPGTYEVIAVKVGFHKTKILNIEIKNEQGSVVDFRLVNSMIPEKPFPVKWKPKYLNK